ncbi:MAG: hypothetical protein COZ98_05460 [Candidatus Omnitrophica bacterium CG_4_8_14_3_um_filter_43_15]|nr:MAG: hypothetical protein AUJ89_01700 [Candidatus Omnitrophica bacterium CG1_02_43_210]PIW79832.1 MAG: hypothetical protein COZ98_05460 [Candidatus Omnitrophica bacterium CG_4_8_14_3_um_filter_43_15]PIY84232.1 MAG: hypothetical protein COY77_03505 [Candidatus Omnitrophica bacterium CG_4_10_14_0_8_um_filter_43_18]PJC46375.1 MAG: hypothetical protein CO036_03325 [Candidatus Omnitrophica bacterium CG_4_9_14_0_2_um_filter_43_12]
MKNKEWSMAQAVFFLPILFSHFKISGYLPNVIRYFDMSCMIIGIALAIYVAISFKSNLKPSPKRDDMLDANMEA